MVRFMHEAEAEFSKNLSKKEIILTSQKKVVRISVLKGAINLEIYGISGINSKIFVKENILSLPVLKLRKLEETPPPPGLNIFQPTKNKCRRKMYGIFDYFFKFQKNDWIFEAV